MTSRRSNKRTDFKNKKNKEHIEFLGESMLNGILERIFNNKEGVHVKITRYPGASSTDIVDQIHIKEVTR